MSGKASQWAWQVVTKTSSEKLVLLALAERADEYFTCFPSIARIHKDTQLNRKTIGSCLTNLLEQKLIFDTGRRKGRTKGVRIFRLKYENKSNKNDGSEPNIGTTQTEEIDEQNNVNLSVSDPKNGNATESEAVPNLPISEPNIGTAKQSQICQEAVPILPPSDPKNGMTKRSQFWDTEPISIEPIKEPFSEPAADAATPTPENSTQSRSRKFSMFIGWQPGDKFQLLCRTYGLDLNSLPPDRVGFVIGEFVSFWLGQHGAKFNQHQWENKLFQQIQRNKILGGNHHETHQRPYEKLSTVEAASRAAEAYRQELRRGASDSGCGNNPLATDG